uniref:Uncharacterized protein n=1 Tax=Cacopsylla melanoneura TaxID=428564 RepID=A0A8D8XG21_9HEMI
MRKPNSPRAYFLPLVPNNIIPTCQPNSPRACSLPLVPNLIISSRQSTSYRSYNRQNRHLCVCLSPSFLIMDEPSIACKLITGFPLSPKISPTFPHFTTFLIPSDLCTCSKFKASSTPGTY